MSLVRLSREQYSRLGPAKRMAYRRYIAGQRFLRHPAVWVDEVLGEEMWSKQSEILEAVRDHRRVAVPSCHGPGKSWTAARVAAWWIANHTPGEAFVVSTAPTFAQVRAILWRELHRAHKHGALIGRLNQTEWSIGDELVGFGRKPSDWDPSAFQGIHARFVLVLLDEACGIPESIWTATETLVTNEDSRILAIGNPDDPTSKFAKVCGPNSGWHRIPISVTDTPNFTGEAVSPALATMLPSVTWVEERAADWGEDSALYQAKVLGRFPDQSKDALIPLSWIERARERGRERDPQTLTGPTRLGADVALTGDETVILALRDGYAWVVEGYRGKDTMETAGRVALARRAFREDSIEPEARIDAIGIGRGVFDRLHEQAEPGVFGLLGSAGAQDPVQFANARAEWYWQLRSRLNPGTEKHPNQDVIDLDPEDEELAEQLSLIRYRVNSRGRIQIESKEDMAKRGVHSPDRADALMLAAAQLPDLPLTVVIEQPEHERIHTSDY